MSCLLTIEGIPYYAGVLPARLFQIKHTLFSLPFLPVSFLFSSLPKQKVHDIWKFYASKKMYEVAKKDTWFWSLHCTFWGNFALSWVELEEINFKSQLGEVDLRSPSVRRRVYLCLYRANMEYSQSWQRPMDMIITQIHNNLVTDLCPKRASDNF